MSLCPRCRIDLSVQEYNDSRLEECRRCGGKWLDPATLKEIIAATSAPVDKAASRVGVDLTDIRTDGICPRCEAGLEPFNYAGDSGVILDRCPVCGGLWLDGGELEQVLAVVAASERDLDRDIKRFSADLHQEEVRQDVLERQDTPSPIDPLAAAIVNQIADSEPSP
jgi:Zn-finger nucleic acid-binding protein